MDYRAALTPGGVVDGLSGLTQAFINLPGQMQQNRYRQDEMEMRRKDQEMRAADMAAQRAFQRDMLNYRNANWEADNSRADTSMEQLRQDRETFRAQQAKDSAQKEQDRQIGFARGGVRPANYADVGPNDMRDPTNAAYEAFTSDKRRQSDLDAWAREKVANERADRLTAEKDRVGNTAAIAQQKAREDYIRYTNETMFDPADPDRLAVANDLAVKAGLPPIHAPQNRRVSGATMNAFATPGVGPSTAPPAQNDLDAIAKEWVSRYNQPRN
jgi:hypothetical protein